jgi:hypothetical protein
MVDQLIPLSAPLCFDWTVQHIYAEQQQLKLSPFISFFVSGNTGHRRIPEEEQLCSELNFLLAFVPYGKQVLQDVTKNHQDKKCFH